MSQDVFYTCDPRKNSECKKTGCWYVDCNEECTCYQTSLEECSAGDKSRWQVLAELLEGKEVSG